MPNVIIPNLISGDMNSSGEVPEALATSIAGDEATIKSVTNSCPTTIAGTPNSNTGKALLIKSLIDAITAQLFYYLSVFLIKEATSLT
jgi:hypothetical protein